MEFKLPIKDTDDLKELGISLLHGQTEEKREKKEKPWYKNSGRWKILGDRVLSFVNSCSQYLPIEILSGSICSIISIFFSVIMGVCAITVGIIEWYSDCDHGNLENWIIVAGMFHFISGWLSLMRLFVSSSIILSFASNIARDKIRETIETPDHEKLEETLDDEVDALSDYTLAEKQQKMFNNFGWYFDIFIFYMSVAMIAWYVVGIIWIALNYDFEDQNDCPDTLWYGCFILIIIFILKAVFIVPWATSWCSLCWFFGCWCFWETLIQCTPFCCMSTGKCLVGTCRNILFLKCIPREGESLFGIGNCSCAGIVPDSIINVADKSLLPLQKLDEVETKIDNTITNLLPWNKETESRNTGVAARMEEVSLESDS